MANATNKSQAKRKPAYTYQLGDVSASVFREKRVAENGHLWNSYSVSLQRSYVDPKTEKRVYVSTLFERDLLDAAQTLTRVYHWIENDRREDAKAAAQEEAEANGES